MFSIKNVVFVTLSFFSYSSLVYSNNHTTNDTITDSLNIEDSTSIDETETSSVDEEAEEIDFLTKLREYNSQVRTQSEYERFIEENNTAEFYTFKVQVGAYQRPEYRNLNQFDPLERVDDDNRMTRYFWGTFKNLKEAEERRKLATEKNIHDAFIAIYFGEQRLGVLIYPKS